MIFGQIITKKLVNRQNLFNHILLAKSKSKSLLLDLFIGLSLSHIKQKKLLTLWFCSTFFTPNVHSNKTRVNYLNILKYVWVFNLVKRKYKDLSLASKPKKKVFPCQNIFWHIKKLNFFDFISSENFYWSLQSLSINSKDIEKEGQISF